MKDEKKVRKLLLMVANQIRERRIKCICIEGCCVDCRIEEVLLDKIDDVLQE